MPISRNSTACAACWTENDGESLEEVFGHARAPAPNGSLANRSRNRHVPWNFSIFAHRPGQRRRCPCPARKHFQSHLAAGGAGRGSTEVQALLASDDTGRMLEALRGSASAGAARRQPRLPRRGRRRRVSGQARGLVPGQCRHGVSTALTAALALSGGRYQLSGVPRMHERPIGDLVDAVAPDRR